MHESTFQYLLPTPDQKEKMEAVRVAAMEYGKVLQANLPDGPSNPDGQFVYRLLRDANMWAMVAITRQPNGAPR